MSDETRLSHRLQFALYRGVERLLSALPWATLVEAGRMLGLAFWLVDGRHRRVVRESVRGTDLDLDEAAVRRLSRACFAHFGAVFLTSIRLYQADPEEVARWVRVEGLEHYDAARAMGLGVIQIAAHHGNWEALGLIQSLRGRPTAAIARPVRNPLLDDLLTRYRCRFGNTVLPKGGAVQRAVRALKEGACVGFVADQDALTSGIWVKFLGRWASTFPTAGNLAVRLGCPILPTFSWPEEDGGYRVRFDPPFLAENSGDLERDTWVATQRIADCISREVHRDPRWYLWMHHRFKTRPGEGNPLPAPLPDPAWALALPSTT